MRVSLERVKTHMHQNKNAYISAVTGVGAGALAVIALTQRTNSVNNQIIQGLAYKSPPKIEVFVEALGDPGNIIQDLESGTIYASQGQAARELGVNPSAISKQLSGNTEHVNGHRFRKLGKAMAAE